MSSKTTEKPGGGDVSLGTTDLTVPALESPVVFKRRIIKNLRAESLATPMSLHSAPLISLARAIEIVTEGLILELEE